MQLHRLIARSRHLIRWGTLLAVTLGLAACTANASSESTPDSSTIGWPRQLESPTLREPSGRDVLGATLPSEEDRALVWRAQELLIEECMASRGFRYEQLDAPSGSTDLVGAVLPAIPATFETTGYGSEDPDSVPAKPAESADEFDAAYFGTDDGDPGCVTSATTALKVDGLGLQDVIAFSDQSLGMVAATVIGGEEFRATMADWSRCMNGRGFVYRDISSAVSAVSGSPGGSTGTTESIELAKADLACRLDIDASDRVVGEIDRVSADLMKTADFIGAWQRVEGVERAIVRNARSILEGDG